MRKFYGCLAGSAVLATLCLFHNTSGEDSVAPALLSPQQIATAIPCELPVEEGNVIQLVAHDEIVRLPSPTKAENAPRSNSQWILNKFGLGESADRTAEQPTIAEKPPMPAKSPVAAKPTVVESMARATEAAKPSAKEELALIPMPRPLRVKSLDLNAPAAPAKVADNDHQRFVEENLKVSPLSGLLDFESPMDVTALGGSQTVDAPLSPGELTKLELSPETTAQAQRMMDQATRLADRGALFAARDQFLRVVRMITQSVDARVGRSYHTRCLARGLRAIEEADDFAATTQYVEADVDLEGYIAGHETSTLHDVDASTLTPLTAMRSYYDYAHSQLIQAGAGNPIASKALFAMGRAEALMAQMSPREPKGPKPLAFYNAALAIDPANSQAANELGVTLARAGHLKHAADVLQRSAEIAPTAICLQNLRRIYDQLGMASAASRVASQHNQLARMPGALRPSAGGPQQRVVWTDPHTFSETPSAIDPVSHSGSTQPAANVTPTYEVPPQQAAPRRQAVPQRTRNVVNQWW